jgi:CheY-like chemotaxis protein
MTKKGQEKEPGKQTILIVDDELELLKLFRTELEPDFQILTAQDGEEGLVATLLHKPDIIILDINMPELNGWELCYLLRQIPSARPIPIIFLSSRSDLPDRIKSMRMGADDFIAKPFSMENLVKRVRIVLGRVKNRQRLASGSTASVAEMNTLLIDLMEYLRATRRSGVISYSHDRKSGQIQLSGGHVIGATYEDSQGEPAVRQMLLQDAGEITFREKPTESGKPIIRDWTSFVASFLPAE